MIFKANFLSIFHWKIIYALKYIHISKFWNGRWKSKDLTYVRPTMINSLWVRFDSLIHFQSKCWNCRWTWNLCFLLILSWKKLRSNFVFWDTFKLLSCLNSNEIKLQSSIRVICIFFDLISVQLKIKYAWEKKSFLRPRCKINTSWSHILTFFKEKTQKDSTKFHHLKMTLKLRIFPSWRRLLIILVCLTITWRFSTYEYCRVASTNARY